MKGKWKTVVTQSTKTVGWLTSEPMFSAEKQPGQIASHMILLEFEIQCIYKYVSF